MHVCCLNFNKVSVSSGVQRCVPIDQVRLRLWGQGQAHSSRKREMWFRHPRAYVTAWLQLQWRQVHFIIQVWRYLPYGPGGRCVPTCVACGHLILMFCSRPVGCANSHSLLELTFQSLASLTPTYLTTDIQLVSEYGRRPLRSSTDRTLIVPWTHNRFGDRSFAVAGPRLWNNLPISLRQISSYGQFRRYLKNHLFGIWEITAQCDAWFSALYKYSYLLTYLLTGKLSATKL